MELFYHQQIPKPSATTLDKEPLFVSRLYVVVLMPGGQVTHCHDIQRFPYVTRSCLACGRFCSTDKYQSFFPGQASLRSCSFHSQRFPLPGCSSGAGSPCMGNSKYYLFKITSTGLMYMYDIIFVVYIVETWVLEKHCTEQVVRVVGLVLSHMLIVYYYSL